MKAKRGVWDAQLFNNLTGSEPAIPALNDQPKDVEPRLLPESQKSADGLVIVHISNYMEIL